MHFDLLINFTRFEYDLLHHNWNKIFTFDRGYFTRNTSHVADSVDGAADVAIATICTFQANICNLILSWYSDLSLLKADVSWFVLIQDEHSAFGIITLKFFSASQIYQMHFKIFIRLPLGVINDSYLDVKLFLAFFHGKLLIHRLIFLSSFGATVESFNSEGQFAVDLFLNRNFDVPIGFWHLVLEMFESDDFARVCRIFLINLGLSFIAPS